ncbi:MAG: hypothetical protein HC853_00260 [Anaerolineae bacterium]|nr:hypothetical protein [Anaerolineae bacterium]
MFRFTRQLLLKRLHRNPNLDSRVGLSATAFFIVALPLLLTVFSFAINSMIFTAAYRRGLALATIGVATGSASLDFVGNAPTISADACAKAVLAVCDNVGGCPSTAASASCYQTPRNITVNVRMKPPIFLPAFWGTAGLRDAITATVSGGPGFGINTGE